MENKIYRGSEWRRWDLHIHSNASDGNATPNEIIQEAKSKHIEVIALTDHHTVRNIDEIKQLGKAAGITVISGIEFRTEYGSKSVHMIGLFPDVYNGAVLDAKALNELILCPLELSETTIISKGKTADPSLDGPAAFKKGMFLVQVDFKKAAKLIHQYGGLVSVHAGSKENTIEQMKHDGKSANNVHNLYDSLGTVKEELLSEYVDICEIRKENDDNKFYLQKFNLPSIIASDAHNKEEIGNKYVWIKADATFEGLKQICYEPQERVAIQENKPEEKSGYHVIDSITFKGGIFEKNRQLYLNPNLNTIIGGRSTGKSSLLQCIAGVIDPQNNKPGYKLLEDNINNIEIRWQDQATNLPRDIEYLPQGYMHAIADNEEKLNAIISDIIKTNDINENLYTFEDDVNSTKIDIAQKVSYLFKLQKNLNDQYQTIKEEGESKSINTEIKSLEDKLAVLKTSTNLSTDELTQFERQKSEFTQITQISNIIQNDIKNLSTLRNKDIFNYQLVYDANALSNDTSSILTRQFEELKTRVYSEWHQIIDKIIEELKLKQQTLQTKLNTIQTSDTYKKGIDFINNNIAYKDIRDKIDIEKKKLTKVLDIEKKIKQTDDQKTLLKQEILRLHNTFYSKSENLITELKTSHNGIDITPTLSYQLNNMQVFLESRLNQKGAARQEYIKNIIENYSISNNRLKTLDTFIEKNLMSQIDYKNGNNAENTVSELLSTNWSKIIYELTYQNDKFAEMSQGKQAFVILKLLLEFSNKKCPILIDQPEDSLDNRAIYSELVEYLKKKKKERQIILVTHNSNVVVSADAELIIVANQHGKNSPNKSNAKFEYVAGSLENTSPKKKTTYILESQGIREHVCEVLEGGKQAFENREKKYGFKNI